MEATRDADPSAPEIAIPRASARGAAGKKQEDRNGAGAPLQDDILPEDSEDRIPGVDERCDGRAPISDSAEDDGGSEASFGSLESFDSALEGMAASSTTSNEAFASPKDSPDRFDSDPGFLGGFEASPSQQGALMRLNELNSGVPSLDRALISSSDSAEEFGAHVMQIAQKNDLSADDRVVKNILDLLIPLVHDGNRLSVNGNSAGGGDAAEDFAQADEDVEATPVAKVKAESNDSLNSNAEDDALDDEPSGDAVEETADQADVNDLHAEEGSEVHGTQSAQGLRVIGRDEVELKETISAQISGSESVQNRAVADDRTKDVKPEVDEGKADAKIESAALVHEDRPKSNLKESAQVLPESHLNHGGDDTNSKVEEETDDLDQISDMKTESVDGRVDATSESTAPMHEDRSKSDYSESVTVLPENRLYHGGHDINSKIEEEPVDLDQKSDTRTELDEGNVDAMRESAAPVREDRSKSDCLELSALGLPESQLYHGGDNTQSKIKEETVNSDQKLDTKTELDERKKVYATTESTAPVQEDRLKSDSPELARVLSESHLYHGRDDTESKIEEEALESDQKADTKTELNGQVDSRTKTTAPVHEDGSKSDSPELLQVLLESHLYHGGDKPKSKIEEETVDTDLKLDPKSQNPSLCEHDNILSAVAEKNAHRAGKLTEQGVHSEELVKDQAAVSESLNLELQNLREEESDSQKPKEDELQKPREKVADPEKEKQYSELQQQPKEEISESEKSKGEFGEAVDHRSEDTRASAGIDLENVKGKPDAIEDADEQLATPKDALKDERTDAHVVEDQQSKAEDSASLTRKISGGSDSIEEETKIECNPRKEIKEKSGDLPIAMQDDSDENEDEEDAVRRSATLDAAVRGMDSSAGGAGTPSLGSAGPSLPARPAGLGRSMPSLEPASRTAPQPSSNGVAASRLSAPAENNQPTGELNDTDSETREKLHAIRVKFLRLAHRLSQSSQNVVVAQVLYRLGLAEQLKGGGQSVNRSSAFSYDRASAIAEEQEAAGQEGLDFTCTIMLLGKTGVGKSATINSIFDEVKAPTSAFRFATRKVQAYAGSVHGIKLRVIDTPGLLPSVADQRQNEKSMASVKRFIKSSPPDIVLYFDRLDMQSRDFGDILLLRTITNTFGPAIWFNAIVVLTHASSAPPDGPNGVPVSYEMFVAQRSHAVQQTIRQAAGDTRLMNPVSLVENHTACRRNRAGERVLPNGQIWKPQLLLLSFASKILAEANSLLKLQESAPGKPFVTRSRVPPLPYLLSSLLQSRAQVKMPEEQMGGEEESDEDVEDESDEEVEYDELPPFRRLSKDEVEDLDKEQRRLYFQELEDREKLFQKKQWKEELRRRKEMKKRMATTQKTDLPPPDEVYDEDGGKSAAVPVALPDMALPPSFDSDNPGHRYRCIESASQWLVRPVLETHGWDHDSGYDGLNLEKMFIFANKFPVSLSGQITKDKKEANMTLESATSLRHGEGKVTLAGIDVQTMGKDLSYTLRSETRFSNFKHNKTIAGLAVTLLGDTIAAGLKLEDRLLLGKRLKLVMNGGAITGRGDIAHGGTLEISLRGKDYPISRSLLTLGFSVMNWHGDLAIGGNLQSQFMMGKTMLVARGNLNNRGAGQISIRASSSEQFQMALIGIIPIVRALFGNHLYSSSHST